MSRDPELTPTAASVRRGRASLRVGAGILLSRIAGLVRERVFAHFFGVGAVADAWGAALRLPNVLQNLLGEGTLSASFIPIYAGLLEEGREREAARFAGAVFGILTLVAGAMAVLGILLAPLLVGIFFSGFAPETRALTVALVRILFPMTAILVISAWALGILNSHRRFFLSYVAPVAWNAGMIIAMVLGGTLYGMDGAGLVRILAFGALIGGALQFGVQAPVALRLLGEFRPAVSLQVEGVREAIRNFVPVVMARGAVNVGSLLDYALAGFLAVGAVSTLRYAQTLYLLPIALFGMAVAASELPELSRDSTRGGERGREIAEGIRSAVERMAFFLIPSSLVFLFLGDVVVAAIFQTGAFGPDEVLVTWAILAAYALGISASATSRLLSSGFYALRDTRTPARVAYLRVGLSLGIGALLMFPLDGFAVGALRLGAVGLALGAAVAAWTELLVLRHALNRRIGGIGADVGVLTRMVLAGAGAAAAGVLVHPPLISFHPWVVAGGTLGVFSGVYLILAWSLGVREPFRFFSPGRSG